MCFFFRIEMWNGCVYVSTGKRADGLLAANNLRNVFLHREFRFAVFAARALARVTRRENISLLHFNYI